VKRVVIIGAGGFGREVLELLKDQNEVEAQWEILGFVDDSPQAAGKVFNGYPVLGDLSWLAQNSRGLGCVCAIGEPAVKRKVVESLDKAGVSFYNAIHPSVIMSEHVHLGKGVIICAGSILTTDIKIGNHVIINLNTTVGHDSTICDYCSLMPAVVINGNNHLGTGVYVGTGATFIQNISVGEWTTIGAGALVVKDIEGHVVATGTPASVTKRKVDV
jgi:sugar O-acyltransferase (sialic acid O-acetyltransferase NeuD family)